MFGNALITIAFTAFFAGGIIGAFVGAWVAKRRVRDLTDLYHADSRRMVRGALIGTLFGGFILPKLAVVVYVIRYIFSKF